MKPLSQKHLNALREVLLRCGPFEEGRQLRALFVDDRLDPWRNSIPEAHSPEERVNLLIDFLFDKYHSYLSQNALLLFLEVLRDQIPPERGCHRDVDRMWQVLESRPGLSTIAQAASQTAVLYEQPPIMARAEELFGRERYLDQLAEALAGAERVLLSGMAGSGKTALAARAAEQYMTTSGYPVIWLECGLMGADRAFEALAQRLGTETDRQILYLATGDADQKAVHDMLANHPGYLLVIDNVWNGQVLEELLPALPASMPFLATSRTAFSFGFDRSVKLKELELAEALALLSAHAGRDLTQKQEAAHLCRTLGFHAYSIELAGTLLKDPDHPVGRLQRRVERNPLFVEVAGKKTMGALLDESVRVLPPSTQEVFTAAGGLAAPGTTPEFLAVYLDKDVDTVWQELDRLEQRNLARYMTPADGAAGGSAPDFYRFHDLTFSYMQARYRAGNPDPWDLVRAARAYLADYAGHVDHVHQDLPNILGAAWRAKREDEQALVEMMRRLTLKRYADTRGYTLEFLQLLDAAIAVVRRQGGESQWLHYLLGKRGNAHYDRGEPEQALAVYREALALAPNPIREILLRAIIGRVLTRLQRYAEADEAFRQAWEQVASNGQPDLGRLVLEQESLAASYRHDFVQVRRLAEQGIAMSIEVGDRLGEAHFRNNLGSAILLSTGDAHTALEHHRRMLELAQEGNDHALEAVAHLSLVRDYHALNEHATAHEHLNRADLMFRNQGNVDREIEVRRLRQELGYMGGSGKVPDAAGAA